MYYVYDDTYKASIKEFRSINKSKLCNTNSKQYVLDIRNARARGEQLTECYESKYKEKMSIWYLKIYGIRESILI